MILKLLVLGVLLGLFYAEEDWRGKRDWEKYKRQLEAKGVELDWKKLIPPPVPDEKNFAMTPFLAPLFDLNPRPFGPGRPPWRDSEGWERIKNYAAALNPTNEVWKGEPDQPAEPMTDLEGALFALRMHTNSEAVKPVFSTRGEAASAVLTACGEFSPVLEELRAASRRPFCRYNIDYNCDNPAEIWVPHVAVLRRVNRILQIRASAELELRKTNDAFADTLFMLFLTESLRDEPLVISHAARLTMQRAVKEIIWEGLAEHRWSDAQLRELQVPLRKMTVMGDLKKPLMTRSAAFGLRLFEYLQSHPNGFRDMLSYREVPAWGSVLLVAPAGWMYQEEISCQRLYAENLPMFFAAQSMQIYPRKIDDFWNRMEKQKVHGFSSFLHHVTFSQMLMPNLLQLFQYTAVTQTGMDEGRLACALERYRMANGSYPETLGALIPQYIGDLPTDVCNGQPLIYRREKDGFVLYSVGWNERDDGGNVVTVKGEEKVDLNQGDWVWPRYSELERAIN